MRKTERPQDNQKKSSGKKLMAEFQFHFLSPYSLTFITDDHDLNPPRVSGMDQVFFQIFFKTEVLVNQFGLTAESGAGCCSIIYRELSL